MNLTSLDLKRKVGPLPVGAWLGILALGLGAAWVMSRRSSPASSAAPVDSGVPLTPMGDPLSGFTATGIDAVNPLSPAVSTPSSNQEWLSLAAKNLQALRRPYAPSEIIAALTKFVNGDAKTDRETEIVNDAIKVTGYPPEAVPTPLAPAPTAAPVNPTAPGQPGYERTAPNLVPKSQLGKRRTRVGTVTVGTKTRGERADEIARRVYGSSTHANYIRYFNPDMLKGKLYTTPLPVGAAVAY